MQLKFSKMHGLGNDFVVLDGIRQSLNLSAEQIRFLADRHFGIGCDQILLVERPGRPDAEFRYRIFNADGGEVEQCGNGARCFARFVRDQGFSEAAEIRVETQCGVIVPRFEDSGDVTVDMGTPRFLPHEIPCQATAPSTLQTLRLADGTSVSVFPVSMGNPHAVQRVASVDTAAVAVQGPQIEAHAFFPQRVNAGFMEIVSRHQIRLRVYERGAGETLACGTGACAAVVAGIQQDFLESPVRVQTRGGELRIVWEGPDTPVLMTGPATTVFSGEIEL